MRCVLVSYSHPKHIRILPLPGERQRPDRVRPDGHTGLAWGGWQGDLPGPEDPDPKDTVYLPASRTVSIFVCPTTSLPSNQGGWTWCPCKW